MIRHAAIAIAMLASTQTQADTTADKIARIEAQGIPVAIDQVGCPYGGQVVGDLGHRFVLRSNRFSTGAGSGIQGV